MFVIALRSKNSRRWSSLSTLSFSLALVVATCILISRVTVILGGQASARLPWWSNPPQMDQIFWSEFSEGFPGLFSAYKSGTDPTVEMEGPTAVRAGDYGQWAFIFTVGSAGLNRGESIAVGVRHASGWGTAQTLDPKGANFVTASSSGNVTLSVHAEQYYHFATRYYLTMGNWQHFTEVTVTKGRLLPGQTIRLVFGDRSQGSPGYRTPPDAREHGLFLACVRRNQSEQLVPIPKHLSVRILGGSAVRLNVVVPSNVLVGKPFRVILRAEDAHGNLSESYRGTVHLAASGRTAGLPSSYTFRPSDVGLHIFPHVLFTQDRLYRIHADDLNVPLSALSNPSRCTKSPPGLRVFWGDLHDHSVYSDGTGSPMRAFLYARDLAGLDFFALSDHDSLMDNVRWKLIQRLVTTFNNPPNFVTIYGYEWSGHPQDGGNHNVYFQESGMPVYRSNDFYLPQDPFSAYNSGLIPDAPQIMFLYERLKRLVSENGIKVLVIPHVRGGAADPRWWDAQFSPVIELTSEAGWNEAWALKWLKRGYHVGFIGSSDDHEGRPGYGRADLPTIGYNGDPSKEVLPESFNKFAYPWGQVIPGSPLAAVFAPQNGRRAISGALFKRHCYATTGARILLDFKADDHIMGDEFVASSAPHFEASVDGTGAIAKIILKKDGQPIYTVNFQGRVFHGQLSYTDLSNYKGHFYYVEVIQQDPQQRAVSSPIWVE